MTGPISISKKKQRIALFGGTFDPVHLGHLHVASAAMMLMDLDQVRFIPCHISPHKKNRPPTSAEHRLEMLRIATASTPWAVIDSIEIDQGGISYSIDTVQKIYEKIGGCELFWILGNDQWEALPKWKNSKELAKLVEFIVVARHGKPMPRTGYRLHVIHSEHPASSQEIRRCYSQGAVSHPWLTDELSSFIEEQRLYYLR